MKSLLGLVLGIYTVSQKNVPLGIVRIFAKY